MRNCVIVFLLLLSTTVFGQNVIKYEVQMRWMAKENALSISQNAVGMPPNCEECFAPIESISCGYNLTSGFLENGDEACFTIDDEAGFGVKVKFNNAAFCTSNSQPYKPEWAVFVNNIPNGYTGTRTANITPIDQLTTLSIACQVNTQPLTVLKTHSIPLTEVIRDATESAYHIDVVNGYDLLTGNKFPRAIKTKMEVFKAKRVEYMIRQYETELLVLASTSRDAINIEPPKSHVNPRYDIWVAITDHPVDEISHWDSVQPINNGKCDSLASNNKDNLVSINLSSSGDDGACYLDGSDDYWLVWYILDKEPDSE